MVEKTFRLSVEADAFLRKLQSQREHASESDALDAILTELMLAEAAQALDAAYKKSYDSLPDEFFQEQREWGEYVQAQLPQILSEEESL
jgi:hypothetical protein